ncbi:septal ring lytic transglycosylase RlpA family protein [Methylophaga sp. OBS3]|uniref:septal ring lytic transglycosylase RlpA family protein n=1 Tax=Methylophaga sp. OBS3 TaxID=2991934 RepID=UPI002B1CC5E8|nr:septal ring lytic transglycosylase RlpA family protein [Methylophaga sp. OBS3]
MILRALNLALVSCGVLWLVACTSVTEVQDSAPTTTPSAEQMRDAVPKVEPRSKYGNPASYEVFGKRYYTLASHKGYVERGIASWYGNKFHGRRTSSGELYDMYKMTAAHKTLPLPSYAEVTNLDNGRKVIVKINDRGPFHGDRLIDLSYSAATKLGITAKGTGRVEVRAIDVEQKAAKQTVKAPQQVALQNNTLENLATFLQVGAFSTLAKAEQIKHRIQQEISERVQIKPFSHEGNSVYRVRVGPLASVEAGQKIAERLLSLGFNETQMITEQQTN